MARRRVDSYPQAESLARTFLKDDVQLSGARRFLCSEGVVVFAAEKQGVATAAGQTWMRPSAYRRAAEYLDLRMNPAICGFNVSRRPTRGQIEAVPVDLFEQFRVAAESTLNTMLDDRRIELRSAGQSEIEGWA